MCCSTTIFFIMHCHFCKYKLASTNRSLSWNVSTSRVKVKYNQEPPLLKYKSKSEKLSNYSNILRLEPIRKIITNEEQYFCYKPIKY